MFAAAAAQPLDVTAIVVALIGSTTTIAALVMQQGYRTRKRGSREHTKLLETVHDLVTRVDHHLVNDHGYQPRERKDSAA